MRLLVEQLQALEARLRLGGGSSRIDRQHRAGKMTARERIAGLLDAGSPFLEIGLLIAYDRYDGQAPAAGVVTGIGRIEGRPAVVVANDATVKAGSWWPETITKILRAQEIAMRNHLPIVYLVDSAGVNLPYQDGIFPGQYGAGRIFYYNSLMRRKLRIPQIAAVMGPCIAGRRLPARAERRHHHGGGHQLHGAGRPQPREGRDRAGDRRRIAGRRAPAHGRRAAWRTTWRRTMPIAWPASASGSARSPRRPRTRRDASPPATSPISTAFFPPITACPTKWRRSSCASSTPATIPNSSPSMRPKCCARMPVWRGARYRSSPIAAAF